MIIEKRNYSIFLARDQKDFNSLKGFPNYSSKLNLKPNRLAVLMRIEEES